MYVPLAKIAPVSDPYMPYKVASPKIIHGQGGLPDVIVYNVTTNFQAIDTAHKASFIPKTKVKSSYARYVPDIGDLPESGTPFDEEERQRIINEGVIPEVLPFMTGARIALAERQADRQHRKAQRFASRAHVSRRTHVANNAAKYIVENGDYTDPENKFPPTTLLELGMAKRMGRLIRRARHFNQFANAVEYMYTPPGKTQADFEGDPERQSIFEAFQRTSSRNLHKRRIERANRQLVGRRIPLVGKRIGLFSFEGLAAGGPGNSVNRAKSAVKKRDDAVLKAEALRRAKGEPSYSLMSSEGSESMAKEMAETLQGAIQEHGEKAILDTADQYSAAYLRGVQALNMDPVATSMGRRNMLGRLVVERYMLRHPDQAGSAYEDVSHTDPFTSNRDEGLAKRTEVIDRLVGAQFTVNAVKSVGDDFEIDHAFVGSLAAIPDNEQAVLEAALQCRRAMEAGQPVRLTALTAIGRAYRLAADLLKS